MLMIRSGSRGTLTLTEVACPVESGRLLDFLGGGPQDRNRSKPEAKYAMSEQLLLPAISTRQPHLCLCAMIEPWEGISEWLERFSVTDGAATFERDGEPCWLSATADMYAPDMVHFHVELFAGGVPEDTEVTHESGELVKRLTDFVKLASGQEAYTQVHGRLLAPRQDLPEHGFIAKLLGLRHQSCGAKFSLAGGTLTMEEDAFTKMSFKYDAEDNEVLVDLWAEGFAELDYDVLVSWFELLTTGFDCFVFESVSREQTTT